MASHQVLVAIGGHPYDNDSYSEMLESLEGVACTHVEQPAAQGQFGPEQSGAWDAFLMYDMPGYEFHADHSAPTLVEPPETFRRDFLAAVEGGHGFVFLHHALAAWPTWDEYGEIMGGRFRFVRDQEHPDWGYRHAVTQHISAVATTHPVLAGLENGFEIEDELYLASVADDGIEPLLVTDADLTDRTVWSMWNAVIGRRDTNDGWTHPPGSGVVAWVREHPKSRIVYIQFGDKPAAFANDAFRKLVSNALAWVADRPADSL